MGGFGSFISDNGFRQGMHGAVVGARTGAGIANAQYNASAMRMHARGLERQGDVTAYLIRKQYESEYDALQNSQERQQSMNRVLAVKRGITGASADAAMQSYAAQGRKNLETLYYNAAMRTGKQAVQTAAQTQSLRAKAAQYDWPAANTLVSGALSLSGSLLEGYSKEIQGVDGNATDTAFGNEKPVPTPTNNSGSFSAEDWYKTEISMGVG